MKNTNNINNLNSILIGIMLSDGGLYRSSPTANTSDFAGNEFW